MSSRVESSKKNVAYGFAGKLIQLIIKFALRTVLIYYLGAVYIGLDGLFLNVITVLSITELGIGSAVCFALYRPLKDSDEYKISAYIRFYRNVYGLIGIIIFVLGTLITPMLKYIINFPADVDVNYYVIYFLFLINTITSYLCGAYKQVLFTADQKNYINTNVTNVVYLGIAVLQVVLLILTKNYYLYLAAMILGSVVTNLYISHIVTKNYPYLLKYKDARLPQEDKVSLKKNVYALAVTKISTVIYTSSDNIVISSLIGTLIVGYYSNYAYVISAVTSIVAIFFSSILASVGNAYVTETQDVMFQIYKRASYINVWIYGVFFTCFLCLLQDFIRLWAGKEYVLDVRVMITIVFMFLTQGLHHTTTIFKDACGLFWQTRYRTIATAIINIIASVILVLKFGLIGCFLGTIIAYFLTTFIVDPKIVYGKVFGRKSSNEFYIWYGKNLFIVVIIAWLNMLFLEIIVVNSWFSFFIKAAICFTLVNIAYLCIFSRQEEFNYFWKLIKKHILEKKR